MIPKILPLSLIEVTFCFRLESGPFQRGPASTHLLLEGDSCPEPLPTLRYVEIINGTGNFNIPEGVTVVVLQGTYLTTPLPFSATHLIMDGASAVRGGIPPHVLKITLLMPASREGIENIIFEQERATPRSLTTPPPAPRKKRRTI